MQKIINKIPIEHTALFLALFVAFGAWAITFLPLILIPQNLRDHRFVVALVVVVCFGYSIGKNTAEIQNENSKVTMKSGCIECKGMSDLKYKPGSFTLNVC